MNQGGSRIEIGNTAVRCPWCLETRQVDPFNLITLTTSDEVRERLLSGEYDAFPCPVCHRDVPYPHAIVCNDLANQVLIYYFPHPPPAELRDTLHDSLLRTIERNAFEGVPTPPGESWKICVAFGPDELRAMFSGHLDEEGRSP